MCCMTDLAGSAATYNEIRRSREGERLSVLSQQHRSTVGSGFASSPAGGCLRRICVVQMSRLHQLCLKGTHLDEGAVEQRYQSPVYHTASAVLYVYSL